MKISNMTFSATIPVGNYANIQPSIEFSDIESVSEFERVEKNGIEYIKDLYARFSSTGELKENKIRTSSDKINEVLKD